MKQFILLRLSEGTHDWFRNVVIEYALLFLWKLEKLGLKPSDEQSVKNT
jgi:hypothetical protein